MGVVGRPFASVAATQDEVSTRLAGDDIVEQPDVVMDRGFMLPATPEASWPWFAQLGKRRAGWYLPQAVERVVPPSRRALRRIDPALQRLEVGDVIPDWGGRNATFQLAVREPPRALVYRSQRGRLLLSWAIVLRPVIRDTDRPVAATRVHLRLRLAPVRRRWLAESAGGLVDALTVVGLAAGLQERLHGEPWTTTTLPGR